jgi:hypothetical protein
MFRCQHKLTITNTHTDMNQRDYILQCANLPFDLGSLEPEADRLFAAIPAKLHKAWSQARLHSDVVHAGDDIAGWMNANWRTVLPELSERFPAK